MPSCGDRRAGIRRLVWGPALLALTLFLFVKNTEQKCRCNYRTVFASGRVLIPDTIDLSPSKDVMSLFREFQLCDRSRFFVGLLLHIRWWCGWTTQRYSSTLTRDFSVQVSCGDDTFLRFINFFIRNLGCLLPTFGGWRGWCLLISRTKEIIYRLFLFWEHVIWQN